MLFNAPRRRVLWILFTIGILSLLILFGRFPSADKWANVLTNSGHGWVSALIAINVFSLLRTSSGSFRSIHRNALFCVVVTVLVGAVLEAVQYLIGRDAEFSDILTDGLGAVAGAGLYAFAVGRSQNELRPVASRWIALLIGVSALGAIAAPVIATTGAYIVRYTNYPVLMDANTPLGSYFVARYWVSGTCRSLPPPWHDSPQSSRGCHILLEGKKRWGVGLLETMRYWRPFDVVAIDIVNPTSVPLTIKARFFSGSKGLARKIGYIVPLTVPAASRSVMKIPLETMERAKGLQHVDLADVRGFVLSSRPGNNAEEFYLVKVSLQ